MDGKTYSSKGNTIIGNDVWIGYNVTFMSCVTIGDGAIIVTNSTVTNDVNGCYQSSSRNKKTFYRPNH